jgi:hypothetical protein
MVFSFMAVSWGATTPEIRIDIPTEIEMKLYNGLLVKDGGFPVSRVRESLGKRDGHSFVLHGPANLALSATVRLSDSTARMGTGGGGAPGWELSRREAAWLYNAQAKCSVTPDFSAFR